MEDTDLTWRKARASSNGGASCVEVAYDARGRTAGKVRDSKRPEAGHLSVSGDTWRAFLSDARDGKYDLD